MEPIINDIKVAIEGINEELLQMNELYYKMLIIKKSIIDCKIIAKLQRHFNLIKKSRYHKPELIVHNPFS